MPDLITYRAVISACERGKQFDKAAEVFQAMRRQCLVCDVIIYNALISTCEKGMQAAGALEVYQALR